jgi:hypothetical protein
MLSTSKSVIYERSNIIPIEHSNTSPKGEYSLKQNFFDPTKSSPPNDFMIKLRMRVNKYYMDNDDDNLDTK